MFEYKQTNVHNEHNQGRIQDFSSGGQKSTCAKKSGHISIFSPLVEVLSFLILSRRDRVEDGFRKGQGGGRGQEGTGWRTGSGAGWRTGSGRRRPLSLRRHLGRPPRVTTLMSRHSGHCQTTCVCSEKPIFGDETCCVKIL